MNPAIMRVQRYRVSLWSYQTSEPGESPRYLCKETMSATPDGALYTVMHQTGIASAHLAKVVTLRTNACTQVEHVTIERLAQAIQIQGKGTPR